MIPLTFIQVLQALSYCAVILGIPLALRQHYRAVKKEQRDRELAQRDRELGTYNALDEKYIEYLRLCLKYPNLDVFDVPHPSPAPLSPEDERLQIILFTILMSIFERAYLMYGDQGEEVKKRQWAGWESYIQGFCQRDNFRRAWKTSGSTFDTRFQAYMGAYVQPTGKEP